MRVTAFFVALCVLLSTFLAVPAYGIHADSLAQMLWDEVREEYPIIPPVRVTDDFQNDPNNPDAIAAAYFGGIRSDGYAWVTFEQSITPTTYLAWHEAGHAYNDALAKKGFSGEELYDMFWAARGFPGTWQAAFYDAMESKRLGLSAFQRWRLWPGEMWAEAFAAANLGTSERTETYGVPLNHAAMRAFFKKLLEEPFAKYVSEPFGVVTDSNGNADVRVPIYGLKAYEPTVVLVQRVGTTGEEDKVPGLIGQSSDGMNATIRVRGDSIKNGTIWLQFAALQGQSISNPFPVWTDSEGNADVYGVPIFGTTALKATTVIVQRVGTTGTESVVPGLIGQSTNGVTATIRVRGDFVKDSVIWLQFVAVQRYGSNPFPVRTDSQGNADYLFLNISRMPLRPVVVIVQRVGTTGVEKTVPGMMGQYGDSFVGLSTIRVRGDYVKNGTIWVQYIAIQ